MRHLFVRPVLSVLAAASVIGIVLAYSASAVWANMEQRFHGSYLVEFSVHGPSGILASIR